MSHLPVSIRVGVMERKPRQTHRNRSNQYFNSYQKYSVVADIGISGTHLKTGIGQLLYR